MARNAIPTYVTGQVLTAAHLNTYLRDNEAEHWAQILALNANWQSYTPTVNYTGGTTDPTSLDLTAYYVAIGKVKFVQISGTLTRGAGDRSYTKISLPVTPSAGGYCATCVTSFTGDFLSCPAYGESGGITIKHGTMTSNGYLWLSLMYD